MNRSLAPIRPVRPVVPARLLRPFWVTAVALAAAGGAAEAAIVTMGANPVALPNCPDPVLPGKCGVDTAAQVQGIVGNLSQLRIGQGGAGSLLIGANAQLTLDRLNLATSPTLIPSVPDLVVGDNVGATGSLVVRDGGSLRIDVPATNPFQGGLLLGPFAAPAGQSGPTTTMTILEGGRVTVDKIGGFGIGSAVFVGVGAGSNSSLVMDGGINGFGNQALRARLDTPGNLSIGRLGTGSVDVARNGDITANLVLMSTVRDNGISGQAALNIGVNSTLTAQQLLAGIALGGPLGYDPLSPNHGTGVVSVRDTGLINATVVLGSGGTLMGTGTVGPQVLSYGGTVRPGFSPGTLNIAGDFADVGGRIEIEIGPNGSDFLDVLGSLSLDGTEIEFMFVDGFAPGAGFTLDFIDADGLVDLKGVRYSFSGLQAGFLFDVVSNPNTGVLSFTALTAGASVPEPGVPALLGLAGVAAWAASRRRPAAGSRARLASAAR